MSLYLGPCKAEVMQRWNISHAGGATFWVCDAVRPRHTLDGAMCHTKRLRTQDSLQALLSMDAKVEPLMLLRPAAMINKLDAHSDQRSLLFHIGTYLSACKDLNTRGCNTCSYEQHLCMPGSGLCAGKGVKRAQLHRISGVSTRAPDFEMLRFLKACSVRLPCFMHPLHPRQSTSVF